MKWAGLFFGLNYNHIPKSRLYGCIKDTINMRDTLISILGPGSITMYHDDKDLKNTSYDGIVQAIFNLSIRAIKEKLDFVFIHYSGHGSSVQDLDGDEEDGNDEVICPSDFPYRGMIKDDTLSYLLSGFPSYTRVVTIFDSCHSGTITDMPFVWMGRVPKRENNNRIPSKVITISGCQDDEVSGDTGAGGLLTTNLIKVIRTNRTNNIFDIIQKVNLSLYSSGAYQHSVLSSSHDLRVDPLFLPLS